jgi:hypothetical protein
MPSKKELKKTIRELSEQTNRLSEKLMYHNEALRAVGSQTERLIEERNEWRIKFEQAILTPENKVDTEAAFKRGENMALNKFRAWFLSTANSLQTVLEEPNTDIG